MHSRLIQLFAKPPIPGTVKTRLIPDIGTRSATAIYQHCLQHNIQLAQDSGCDTQIWLTEPSDHCLFKQQQVRYQQGKDLGEKMFHALENGLEQGYDKVILMGTDCLDLSASLLHRVCNGLENHDQVLVPALDGGYVLIAVKDTINPNIFDGIDWSTDRVLTQTLERSMQSGINTVVFNPLRDIDRVEDVQHYAELRQYL